MAQNMRQQPVQNVVDIHWIPVVSNVQSGTILSLVKTGYAVVDHIVVDDFCVAKDVHSKLHKSVMGLRVGHMVLDKDSWSKMQSMKSLVYTRVIDKSLDNPLIEVGFSMNTRSIISQYQELALQRKNWDKFRTWTKI